MRRAAAAGQRPPGEHTFARRASDAAKARLCRCSRHRRRRPRVRCRCCVIRQGGLAQSRLSGGSCRAASGCPSFGQPRPIAARAALAGPWVAAARPYPPCSRRRSGRNASCRRARPRLAALSAGQVEEQRAAAAGAAAGAQTTAKVAHWQCPSSAPAPTTLGCTRRFRAA